VLRIGYPIRFGSMPTIGLHGVNMGALADPAAAARIAALCEELGYDSLWTADHVVLPSPRVPPSPVDPDVPILDPVVALAHLAHATDQIRLATGIVILPQRNPLILAKQVATVDVLSGGRVMLGVGVGYLEPEMTAVGVPMADRGTRADEYIAALRSLWHDAAPSADGEYVRFAAVDAYPRPLQTRLPIVVGGASEGALRRAGRHGDGWYGWALDPDQAKDCVDRLPDALEISITPTERLDPKVVARYREAGVHRLIPAINPGKDVDAIERFVRHNAPEAVGADFA
jgi:probable F420-dependent oxidoreductase